ncbi:hypothetical protein [Rhizobium ruizarguesonis]
MTMVDRVAMAIQQASFRMIRPSWDSLDSAEKDQWRIRARAAIESMREPTEAMVEASAAIYGDNYLYRHRYSKDQWRAMVDAALKGEKS